MRAQVSVKDACVSYNTWKKKESLKWNITFSREQITIYLLQNDSLLEYIIKNLIIFTIGHNGREIFNAQSTI